MYRIHSALRPVVFVPGLAFEALIRVRNRLYSADLLPQHRLLKPVISIGNITMGGAGKTPLVIHVAQVLLKLGFTPAILSRGYGRDNSSESHILPPGKGVPFAASTLGDEPALMRRRLPSVWMGISGNRYRAGSIISRQQGRTVFLLDDGFQHRRLHRDMDIVIVDPSQHLASNRVFPRGTLREPLSGLRRSHVVVINGMPGESSADAVEVEIRSVHGQADIFYCSQTIKSLVSFPSWYEAGELGTPTEAVSSAYLATALGNPERFRRDVQRLGIDVRGVKFFPDHYRLRHKDWLDCANEARSKGADTIITTEKDAVKMSHAPDFPLLVAVQSTRISDLAAFQKILEGCVEERQ